MSIQPRKQTQQVLVGNVKVGGGAPIVVQSMTNKDTADVAASVQQNIELLTVGSERVRVTVNTEEAAKALPEIINKLEQKGFSVPIVGDFSLQWPQVTGEIPKLRAGAGQISHQSR